MEIINASSTFSSCCIKITTSLWNFEALLVRFVLSITASHFFLYAFSIDKVIIWRTRQAVSSKNIVCSTIIGFRDGNAVSKTKILTFRAWCIKGTFSIFQDIACGASCASSSESIFLNTRSDFICLLDSWIIWRSDRRCIDDTTLIVFIDVSVTFIVGTNKRRNCVFYCNIVYICKSANNRIEALFQCGSRCIC